LVWGAVGEAAGLEPALLVAAGLLLLGTLIAALTRPVGELGHLDRRPAIYWGEARLAFDPEPDAGPVVVAVEYTVSQDNEPEFLEATNALRSSRLRSGATRWELYRDGLRPDRFVELFSVPSWEEHLRQHEGRLTAADQEIEATVAALSDPPPRADHLLPP
jgi:hypothetical protein